MKITNSNEYGHLDIKTLMKFERLIGATLPKDYSDFLLKYNGGYPEPDCFWISEEESNIEVGMFYCLIEDTSNSNSLEWHYDTFKDRMPDSMITIADGSGNQICIGIKDNDYGKIFFWDHEEELGVYEGDEDKEQPYYDNITLLANSFTEFLDSLYEYVDPNETEVDKIMRTNDIDGLKALLDSGYDIETIHEYDRTLLELATIQNNNNMIKILFNKGAKLRNSIKIAEENAKFFKEHKDTIKLLKELESKSQ